MGSKKGGSNMYARMGMTTGDGDGFFSPERMNKQRKFADMGGLMGMQEGGSMDVMDVYKKGGAVKKKKKKQGYNSRLDESLGMRRGKKKQSMKSRRNESKGAKKAAGKRAYSGNRSSGRKK
tara:strand:+ start:4954 stop:5316 length:363 start_codon:yes stop_codon:yes gene_type:complete